MGKIGIRIEGNGPPVVMLHSSLASKTQWRNLMECMRTTHRMIAIDLYGYGETTIPFQQDGFSLNDEVRLVEAGLTDIIEPGERFHLVGHSYGGSVALRLTCSSMERVRSLTMFEPTAFHLLSQSDPARAEVQTVAQAIEDGLSRNAWKTATQRFIDYWCGDGSFMALSENKQETLISFIAKVPIDFQALFYEPLTVSDCRNINLPMCLIAGRSSPSSTRSVIETLTKALPNNRMNWVDAGHMAPLTHPALVNPIIQDFIAHQVGVVDEPCQVN